MHGPYRRLPAMILVLAIAANPLHAQAGDAPDAMPLADYLGLLEQIAPAARQGAEAYLAAHHQRCGRTMTTGELRLAMSRDGGSPTLMAMIHASQRRDAQAIAVLARQVSCRKGS